MIMRLMLISICFSSLAASDWLEECIEFVNEKNELEVDKCCALMQRRVEEDKEEVKRLKRKLEINDADGFFSMLVGCNHQAQWAKVKSQLAYHKKVAQMFKDLPKNKKNRLWFTKELLSVKSNLQKRADLKKAFSEADSFKKKLVIGSQIAAKEVHITGQKAIIKTTLFL